MLRPIALVAACGLLTACNAGTSLSSGTQTFNAGVGDAVQAPLEDLNLKREEIPEVLLQARGAPYAVTGLGRCAAIGAEIARLDEALGPDIDVPTSGDGEALDAAVEDAFAGAHVEVDALADGRLRTGMRQHGLLRGRETFHVFLDRPRPRLWHSRLELGQNLLQPGLELLARTRLAGQPGG